MYFFIFLLWGKKGVHKGKSLFFNSVTLAPICKVNEICLQTRAPDNDAGQNPH